VFSQARKSVLKETHGHYSHLRAKIWKSHLVDLMKTLPKP